MKAEHIYEKEEDRLTVSICGEIDHHAVSRLREYADGKIDKYRPATLVIDLSGLDFMDSSGIAFIIGRYKKMREYCGNIIISGANGLMLKMLKMTRLDRFEGIVLEEEAEDEA